jgi:hypothetical protein
VKNSSWIEKKEIRRFGLIAFIFFGFLFLLGVWKEKPLPVFLFGFLSCLGFGFLIVPLQLRHVYHIWLKVSHFIGRVFTTIILALAYYLVITPSAFIKRLFGGTPIPLRPDKDASTYWVQRSEPGQPIERFFKRF